MSTVRNWISACRPRTLFLAGATVILGSGLAWHDGHFHIPTLLLTLALSIMLQTLSNLANDLGDYLKGTDTSGHRLGPQRAVQSGQISAREMKRGIGVLVGAAIVTGVALLVMAGFRINLIYTLALLLLGALAILAALFYTLGSRPYGYYGLGDLFAFIFFGPVPVIGTYLLHGCPFGFQPVLPSIGLGLVSTMILNINNMRDIANDRASGKHTVASRLGLQRAKVYHTVLQLLLVVCFVGYSLLYAPAWHQYLYLPAIGFQFAILYKIVRSPGGQALDPYLRLTSVAGFVLAVMFVGGILV